MSSSLLEVFFTEFKSVLGTLGLEDFADCWRSTKEHRYLTPSLIVQLSENLKVIVVYEHKIIIQKPLPQDRVSVLYNTRCQDRKKRYVDQLYKAKFPISTIQFTTWSKQ